MSCQKCRYHNSMTKPLYCKSQDLFRPIFFFCGIFFPLCFQTSGRRFCKAVTGNYSTSPLGVKSGRAHGARRTFLRSQQCRFHCPLKETETSIQFSVHSIVTADAEVKQEPFAFLSANSLWLYWLQIALRVVSICLTQARRGRMYCTLNAPFVLTALPFLLMNYQSKSLSYVNGVRRALVSFWDSPLVSGRGCLWWGKTRRRHAVSGLQLGSRCRLDWNYMDNLKLDFIRTLHIF